MKEDGTIAFYQRLLIDKMLADAVMVHVNLKLTPSPMDEVYHATTEEDVLLPETRLRYMHLIVDLRYFLYCTRQDLIHAVEIVGVSMVQPTELPMKILKATLCYLSVTNCNGLFF